MKPNPTPIQLDANWRLDRDKYSWILIFSEQREKNILDDKRKPTGEKESYTHEQPYYYPTIGMCLKRYLNESLKAEQTIKAMYDKVLEIEAKVDETIAIFYPDGK